MDTKEGNTHNGQRSDSARTPENVGGYSLELGRSQVNLEFLKRFGGVDIPGIGKISLLYKNSYRGKVTVHFAPSTELTDYIQEENDNDGEEQRPRDDR